MFTGIIAAKGEVVALEPRGGDLRLSIYSDELSFDDVQLGDSIATNGVCLTAVALFDHSPDHNSERNPEHNNTAKYNAYSADVSVETLSLTTVGTWQLGTQVNLEKALCAQSRLGGHMVSGHVDGIGKILRLHEDARAWRYTVQAPDGLAKYIAHKGSITVDGTSLTVNQVNGPDFELAIVPHTMNKTVIADYQVGTQVNLEVDLIARYLERLLLGDKAADKAADKETEKSE